MMESIPDLSGRYLSGDRRERAAKKMTVGWLWFVGIVLYFIVF